ncbi:hexosaminidase D-like [Leptopilina heterotoma]|uniref:hexosaminidase D-like n=1 Tax=Leptopilina heterotoma TaxID=63436 RepID=UPI001CA919DB|nr:hexosaminidase D-like [Leptopilina heterotoma]
MIRMAHLRGRTLTIIIVVLFILLVAIYHLLRNEADDPSTGSKVRWYLKSNDMYEYVGSKSQLLSLDKSKDNSKNVYEHSQLFTGHKIVHLDLKGAPPKVSYYDYLFRLFKTLGATGILIEYEDMFPFQGNLIDIAAGNHYSKNEINTIQDLAKKYDLIIIPLVQTFGHLEFVLKLEKYKELREINRYPQSICPMYNKSEILLFEMIDQIISAHPDSKHIHIGADEVYQLGECNRCIETMAKERWNKKELFLNHVIKVARYIKKKYPDLTILTWDDEFREIDSQDLINSGLQGLIEPVVWKYTTDPASSLTNQLWENYALVWSEIWIATAFKGATAPDRYYTDITYHVENHRRWMEIVEKYSSRIKFKGAFLTGWQRYDHFSVLCELLPSALPSLAINLAVLQSNNPSSFPMDVSPKVIDALACDSGITLSVPEPQYGWTNCAYNGGLIYAAILKLFSIQQELNKLKEDSTFKGWFTPYNIKYSFSNPSHVDRAVADIDRIKMELIYLEKELRIAMDSIYDNYTIHEWIETNLVPLNDDIEQMAKDKDRILEKNSWPRRPLIKPDL